MWWRAVLVAVAVVVWGCAVGSVGVEGACPGGAPLAARCSCGVQRYERTHMYVVNCTGADLQTERAHDALASLPAEVEVLLFTGSTVPELRDNVFGEDELPRLAVVDLSDNNIRDISGKAFHHAPNVRRLVLDHNDLDADALRPRLLTGFGTLRELHLTDAFTDRSDEVPAALHEMFLGSALVRLEKLHLEQNELRSLGGDSRALCGLPALMDLHLADNELTAVPALDAHCSPMLRFLDLRRNRITRLSGEDAARLVALAHARPLILDLAANPLDCAAAGELLALPRTTNVTLRDSDSLRCRHRFANGTESWLPLPQAAAAAAADGASGLAVALVSVSALAAVGGALLIFRSRRRRSRARVFGGIVSGSVSYTSIEPEDV